MINLMFCGNNKIFNGLAMALFSITKYCKEPLNVYVLTMDLQNIKEEYKPFTIDNIKKLEEYLRQKNADINIQLIDVTELYLKENGNSINKDNIYTPYAMIRLLADEVEEIPDKILYFDTDIVANGDIKQIYDFDVSNVEYGAVKDYYGRFFINHNYINSGVMLLNMKEIRKTNLFKKARELVNTKKMLMPDQSALNKFVENRIFLPKKFNSQRKLKDGDVIRHFCKSIRWYPSLHSKKSLYGQFSQPMFKHFHLFHFVNIKPWNKEALNKILKCNEFNDIIDELEKFKKDNIIKI